MSRTLAVLLVSPIPPPMGGIAQWTQRVMDHAHHRTEVRIRHLDSSLRGRELLDRGSLRRIRAGFRQVRALRAGLNQTLAQTQIDVIHLTSSGSLGTARDLVLMGSARRRRIPVVYHLRFGRMPEVIAAAGWEARLLRAAVGMAASTIVLDEPSRVAVSNAIPGANCAVLPNPIDVRAVAALAAHSGITRHHDLSSGRYVLFAGHVRPEKGVSDLLRAWAESPIPGWRLVLAGAVDGKYPNELIRVLGLQETVRLTGELAHSDVLGLIGACGVFCLPSYTEGFPNSALEAMALGRPIVATPVGALPEMLREGAGELVPVADPETLSSALRGLAASADKRSAMGVAARARAQESYDMDTVFRQYVGIWNQAARR